MIEITAEYLASQGLSPTFATRFWKKVKKGSPSECWIWTASLNFYGYGQISRKRSVPIRANIASWILNRGPVPKGMCVCHHCDNPACVNPDHLFIGTHQDNVDDKMRKGRYFKGPPLNGEINPASKLVDEDVFKIRKMYALGNTTQRKIAKIFNVSQSAIWRVVTRENWTHVH